jgi:hypothetical protein
MKSLILAALAFPAVAVAAPAETTLPQVSPVCRAQAAQMARQCPIGQNAEAFLQCKARNASLVTPQCSAALRAHITALAAACRADRAPSEYARQCPSFKAHPKAFVSGN